MPEPRPNKVAAINSPHELALGISFGVLIGVMPKDSAIPWVLTLIFMLSRGNLLCGIVAAFAMSIVGPLLDPVSNRMGLAVLSIESLQGTYANWMDLPWVAWTRFNNTVVAGSFAIGLIAWLPIYLVSQVFFRAWGILLIEKLLGLPVIRFLFEPTTDGKKSSPDEPSLIVES